ncbi:MAG: acyltransferase [Rubrivivax sp.]|nr:acyltransferase [Rubrivivax sp.]
MLKRIWQMRGHLQLNALGVGAAGPVRFYGMPIISLAHGSRIQLGPRVVLCSHPRFTALGVARPVVLRTLRPSARIVIGADVGISGGVICAAVSVEIGNQCLLGADVQIVDTDFHPLRAANRRFENAAASIECAPVVIADNVFLGAGVRVLKGVSIGRNTVVGAGSIVASDLPSDVIAAGVPARVIGALPA